MGVDALRTKGDTSSSFCTSGFKSVPERREGKEGRKSLREPQDFFSYSLNLCKDDG